MRFLLTSMGISNKSIENALVELLGKPISESSALLIPGAMHIYPGGRAAVYQVITGRAPGRMAELGWKSLGVLELTALPTVRKEVWVSEVEEMDALLVWGGSPRYQSYWMRESGLADLLPKLRPEVVYVGTSGGAMVVTPDFGGKSYDNGDPLTASDSRLGLVDFSLFPHAGETGLPLDTSMARVARWAAGISIPAYAIDDQTAIKLVDGKVEVVSEGQWKLLNGGAAGEAGYIARLPGVKGLRKLHWELYEWWLVAWCELVFLRIRFDEWFERRQSGRRGRK